MNHSSRVSYDLRDLPGRRTCFSTCRRLQFIWLSESREPGQRSCKVVSVCYATSSKSTRSSKALLAAAEKRYMQLSSSNLSLQARVRTRVACHCAEACVERTLYIAHPAAFAWSYFRAEGRQQSHRTCMSDHPQRTPCLLWSCYNPGSAQDNTWWCLHWCVSRCC